MTPADKLKGIIAGTWTNGCTRCGCRFSFSYRPDLIDRQWVEDWLGKGLWPVRCAVCFHAQVVRDGIATRDLTPDEVKRTPREAFDMLSQVERVAHAAGLWG